MVCGGSEGKEMLQAASGGQASSAVSESAMEGVQQSLAAASVSTATPAPLMTTQECGYIRRQYANRQQKVARIRVWIQATFCKSL